jgi:hypothetical protein
MRKLVLGVVNYKTREHSELSVTLEEHHDDDYVNSIRDSFNNQMQFIATWKIINEHNRTSNS